MSRTLAFLAILCFASVFAASPKKHCPYDRILVATKDVQAQSNVVNNVLDANFNRTLSFACGRLYDSTWPAFIRTEANAWLLGLTGINWTAGAALGNGAYARPEGLFFPFVNGDDFAYRIQSDRVDCKETKGDYNWIVFNTGYIALFTTNGTFPGGALAGQPFVNGYLVSYTEYNFLNEDKQHKWGTTHKNWRQKVIIRSRQPGTNFPNSAGFMDQHVYEELVDENGVIGFSAFSVSTTNQTWIDNSYVQSTRNVMTWPRLQRYRNPAPAPIPCPAPRPQQ